MACVKQGQLGKYSSPLAALLYFSFNVFRDDPTYRRGGRFQIKVRSLSIMSRRHTNLPTILFIATPHTQNKKVDEKQTKPASKQQRNNFIQSHSLRGTGFLPPLTCECVLPGKWWGKKRRTLWEKNVCSSAMMSDSLMRLANPCTSSPSPSCPVSSRPRSRP